MDYLGWPPYNHKCPWKRSRRDASQKRRSPFDHGNRDESDAAVSRGMQAAAGNGVGGAGAGRQRADTPPEL